MRAVANSSKRRPGGNYALDYFCYPFDSVASRIGHQLHAWWLYSHPASHCTCRCGDRVGRTAKSIVTPCVRSCRCANLAIVSEPFIPFTSAKLFTMLNLKANTWNNAGTIDLLKAGDQLGTAELLFDKIEDATIEAQVKKLEDTKQANLLANAEVKPLKENVSFDDFAKMDIRVATIIAAEKVAKTKKLLKLTLKTGIDERTVVSGIAEHFEPEAIIGQQVSLLANLAPREIKGIVSQGMILMAEDADGSLKFVQPGTAVNAGSMIG